jgi:NAD(P)-dependent dehydrogenase (short-subunit alcohol dehydrogenase family)
MTRKTWFITGASRGLGVQIAKAAMDAGDRLVATGRKHEEVVDALGADGLTPFQTKTSW